VATVEIFGWREGFLKVSCTHLLQDRLGLGRAAAKACTDRVLDGERVSLTVSNRAAAVSLAAQLTELGAEARVCDSAAAG
jgi:hypothetical protein